MFFVQVTTILDNGELKFTDVQPSGYSTWEEANKAATQAFDQLRNVVTVDITESVTANN